MHCIAVAVVAACLAMGRGETLISSNEDKPRQEPARKGSNVLVGYHMEVVTAMERELAELLEGLNEEETFKKPLEASPDFHKEIDATTKNPQPQKPKIIDKKADNTKPKANSGRTAASSTGHKKTRKRKVKPMPLKGVLILLSLALMAGCFCFLHKIQRKEKLL